MKYINDPGVYIIENIKTGAFYIGSSHLVKHRINKHKTELRQNVHGNKKLQKTGINLARTVLHLP
jgi:predicted GIY-YIG superfamily endonuclease